MNIDEDELTALRSAALATLAMKPQEAWNETPEEDLTALRQAALMTRKQKQIEVIQRPVEQKTTFTGWLDGGQRGLIYRPESGILPPRNSNIRMIQPVGIRPPPSFPQRRPLFFSPPKTSWGANNLIHLTPGPAAPVPLMSLPRPRHVNMVRPLLPFPFALRQPQRTPTHQNFVVPSRGVFPGSGYRFPRSNRPVQHAVTKVQATEPKNIPQNTPEVKITDKFNRYDPDSSSDDDDEHTTVGSKQKDEESDAESVASDKSFSSVSAVSEGEEKTEIHEDDQDDHNDAGEAKGGISIANEDDGILAAIEEFLDEGTSAAQPKIEQSQNSQISEAKPARAKPLKTQKTVLKTQTTPPAAFTDSNAYKKTKETVSKGKNLTPDEAETRITKGATSTLLLSSRLEIGPVGVGDQNFNTKDRFQQNIKKSKVTKTKKDVLLQNKEKSKQLTGTAESQKPKKIDRPITPITMRNVPGVVNKPPQAEKTVLPIQQRVELPVPLTEGRQRRNSDLDSVGSSDLSFLSSSDSESEISKAPKPVPKQPVKQIKKLDARGKKFAGNLDLELSESVRKTHIKERIGVRVKYEKKLSDEEVKPQTTNRIDLRTMLKREKGEDEQTRPVDLREKIKHRKKVNPNIEIAPTSKQAPIIRKPSPISAKSDRIPPSEKINHRRESTIISLTSKSKSQNLLANARNIVITRKRTPSPTRERDSIRLDSRKQATFEEKRKQSSSSHATVKRMAEKDTKKPSSQILKVKVRKFKDSDHTKGTVDNRKGVPAFKDAPINPNVSRQMSPSKTSASEAESEVVEDIDILDIYEYDDMLFDVDGDEGNAVSSAQKQVTPKSIKRSADTREPEIYNSNSSESVSEEEVAKETKLSSKHVPYKKRNVKHNNTNLKHLPRKRQKSVEIEQPEEPRTYKPTSGSTTGTRRVLITTKSTQDDRKKERQSKRDLKCVSSETENYRTSGKKSMKKRLGSRIVVKKNVESVDSKDCDSDDGWRPVKPRKIVKTKRKKSSSSNKDDRLEARIQRIETQNGLILERQREIQIEKEKFG